MVLKDLPPNLVEQGTIIAHPISEADYLRLYSGQATEWVEGYVIEMASSTVSHRLNRFRDCRSGQSDGEVKSHSVFDLLTSFLYQSLTSF